MKRYLLLSVALLFLMAAEAGAELKMRVHFGHQGLHRFRSWNPLQVRLESGTKATEGRIEVAVPSGKVYLGDALLVCHTRPVSLPPLSAQTFDFSLFIDDISRPLIVSYMGGDGERITRRFDLKEGLITGELIIALSRAPVFDFLSARLGPRGAEEQQVIQYIRLMTPNEKKAVMDLISTFMTDRIKGGGERDGEEG